MMIGHALVGTRSRTSAPAFIVHFYIASTPIPSSSLLRREQEPPAPALHRLPPDLPPPVIYHFAELLDHGRLLPLQNAPRHRPRQRAQELKRGQAQLLQSRMRRQVNHLLGCDQPTGGSELTTASRLTPFVSATNALNTFCTSPTICSLISAGTSFASSASVSITFALSAGSAKSSAVMSSGSSFGSSARVICLGMCCSRLDSATR
jgi:hypothetical protein